LDKGINLKIAELKQELVNTLIKSEMPIMIMSMVLNDLVKDINSEATQAVSRELQEFNKQTQTQETEGEN
jgi:hypothetical protein